MRTIFWNRVLQGMALLLVLGSAVFFRFQHLDWDRGYLFHPDERQMLMVASSLEWPANPADLLTPGSSLNPKFFSYGSFPLYLARLIQPLAPPSELPSPWADARLLPWALADRAVSALADVGVLLLIVYIGRLLYDTRIGIAAAALYAVSALAIQLAHFYTADTLLALLLAGAFACLARYALLGQRLDLAALGVLFGLALATKVTAAVLIVPMLYAFTLVAARRGGRVRTLDWKAWSSTVPLFLRDSWALIRQPVGYCLTIALAVFLLVQPYAVIDSARYIGDVSRELWMARGWLDLPYTRQYLNTAPYVYPIAQNIVWGLGLPLGLAAWGGAALLIVQWARERVWRDGLLVLWGVTFFLAVGGQQAKYPRYLLPLLPVLFLMAVRAWSRWPRDPEGAIFVRPKGASTWRLSTPGWGIIALAFAGGVAWSFAFSSIYATEPPWFQASRWIYEHVPKGSTLVAEEWDDALPILMNVQGTRGDLSEYRLLRAPIYDVDDSAKVETLLTQLAAADYIVLSTPRGWGTIPRLSQRYPITTRYYQGLMDGRLGFDPVMGAHVQPRLGNLVFADDPTAETNLVPPVIPGETSAGERMIDLGRQDESLSVYDHPFTLVLKKNRTLSLEALRAFLTGIP